jgi:hypothetical protein
MRRRAGVDANIHQWHPTSQRLVVRRRNRRGVG